MSPDTCTGSAIRSLSSPISNSVVGYSFTLPEILDPFLLVSEVPANVAQFDCYFINTFQYIRGDYERLENRYLSILTILKVSKVRC